VCYRLGKQLIDLWVQQLTGFSLLQNEWRVIAWKDLELAKSEKVSLLWYL
jgi:hypothetical protein